jgi:hypothetical protein
VAEQCGEQIGAGLPVHHPDEAGDVPFDELRGIAGAGKAISDNGSFVP